MTSGETEDSLPLAETLSKLSAVISRLDGNFSDVATLMSVEDDIRVLLSSVGHGPITQTKDPELAEAISRLISQHEQAIANLDLRLATMVEFGAYLRSNLQA
jgi:hypothetical protein